MASRTPSIKNVLAELNRRRLADLQSRQRAKTILAPEAMQGGGKHSPAHVLWTTLGGVPGPVTNAVLLEFRRSIRTVGKKLRSGVTAREVIDLSAPADRERARAQIRFAIPARLRNGEVVFSVSAGPGSRVARHMVTVVFPDYGAAISRPGTPLQAAAWLGKEAVLKFDCDCEHHRYRLRYIATVGGYNAGRPETGYPKITNPDLSGIACKHVLRTMAELEASAFVKSQIAKMIDADRRRLDTTTRAKPRVITVRQEEADRVGSARVRPISTTDEAEKRALSAQIRAAMGSRGGRQPTLPPLDATLAALQARRDIPSAAILRALQTVLAQHTPERKST